MSRTQQPLDAQPTPEQRTLDFETERDADSTSWQRADPRSALIRRLGRYGWVVCLPDGDAHVCGLGRRPDGRHDGFCKCKGYEYHDGACAHLCTLRKADFLGDVETTTGEVVTIAHSVDRDDLLDAEHSAAQHSGDVFEGDPGAGGDPADHLDRLDELTDAQREVFVSVELNENAPRDAATATDRSPSCARTLLQRARDTLGVDR